jgi:hypothetical protein
MPGNENSEASQYGVYSKSTVPHQDASVADAIASTEGNSSPSVLLARFITELKYFTPPAGATQSGPKGMPLTPAFQVEKLNPQHKFGYVVEKYDQPLKQLLEKAQQLVAKFLAIVGDKANSVNFTQWLQRQNTEDSKAVLALVESWKKVSLADLKGEKNMVNYLDMEMRQKYVIEPGTDGLLYSREPDPAGFKFNQALFDTAMSTAAFGGRSKKAIWIQGPSGRFYSSNESKAGKFHHSSFLAGREVKAAGDWEVDHGKLKTISATSGHYRPPLEAVRGALADLQATSKQILGWGAIVEVYKNGVLTPVPVKEFLDNSEKDKAYLSQFKPVA